MQLDGWWSHVMLAFVLFLLGLTLLFVQERRVLLLLSFYSESYDNNRRVQPVKGVVADVKAVVETNYEIQQVCSSSWEQ